MFLAVLYGLISVAFFLTLSVFSPADAISGEMPENAYPTNKSYGPGWECERGFRQSNGACVALDVPAHAF